jgi:replicative DNA helicase
MNTPESEVKRLIEREKKLAKYDGPDKVITSYEMMDFIQADKTAVREVSLRSRIPTLDAHIVDFIGGELTVISGKTGNGKTLFSQTLTDTFVKDDKHCLWFTFEVTAEAFLNNFGEVVPAILMPKELRQSSLDWVEDRIDETVLKFGRVDAVFIDHLHFLVDMGSRHNMSLEIGKVMRRLKLIALHRNLCMFLMAHQKKDNLENEPTNDDLRDSSFIAQESDNVFFIWRRQDNPAETTLKITKNRRKGVMNAKVSLEKIGNFLREPDYRQVKSWTDRD